jgi:preprotein translocase subunit SecB
MKDDTTDNNLKQDSQIIINVQYVKDLSFESPGAPFTLTSMKNQPQVDLSLDVSMQKIQTDNYEVCIEIKATVKSEDKEVFLIELKYAGLFTLLNIPEEHLEGLLFVHCPSILFPFARRIVADASRDGGFQPLMIDPVDFLAFYNLKKPQLDASKAEAANNNVAAITQ